VKVAITTAGAEASADLARLRAWLKSAGDRAPWRLVPEPAPDGRSLGLGVDEVCVIITAAVDVVLLIDRIGDWLTSKHDPKQIQLNVTIDLPAREQVEDEPLA
jgi:hypothetical protein